MVLRALAASVLVAGCLPRLPSHRAEQQTPVTVALVADRDNGPGVSSAPLALSAKVAEALAARNLQAKALPFEQYSASFESTRDSRRRLAALRQLAPDSPLFLLVETKATFFSQLSGRYRWLVNVRLTAARSGEEAPVEAAFDLPTFVDFDHEKEPEVLSAAASQIAERAGGLFDSFLGAQPAPARASDEADAIYFVMVDRFANGDPSNDGPVDKTDAAAFHGGDLAGLVQHLDELVALGVRTVWLSPLFKMRTEKFFGHGAFHGYWVEDLRRIEPRFGGEEALTRLDFELRRRNLRLVLDVVLNHVAPDAPLTKEHPDWFHQKGPLTDWKDPLQLTTHDVHGLPDLAEEREEVFGYLRDGALGWAQRLRPYGFRLDAVKHMPLGFWARFNDEVRREAGRDFLLLGELLEGNPSAVARAQKEGRFGAMFDFPLYFALSEVFCHGKAPTRLGAVLSQDRLYANAASLVTLADNHDLPRAMTDCGGEVERVKQALTFQLTARGTPSITYGTESGLTGAKEPENRSDMRFGKGPLRAHLSRLLELRRRHPSLRTGAPLMLDATESFFAYARISPDEAAVVAVNRGSEPASVTLPPELEGLSFRSLLGAATLERLEVAPGGLLLALTVAPRPAGFSPLSRKHAEQWRTGARLREVELQAVGASAGVSVVGSSPELGSWEPARGLHLDAQGVARAKLPVGGLYEFKFVQDKDGKPSWEVGENRAFLVAEGEGPMRIKVVWRGG